MNRLQYRMDLQALCTTEFRINIKKKQAIDLGSCKSYPKIYIGLTVRSFLKYLLEYKLFPEKCGTVQLCTTQKLEITN